MRYHRVRSPALLRALARTLLLFWCVLSLTFALLRLAPGDPATFLLAAGRQRGGRGAAASGARTRSLDRGAICTLVASIARAAILARASPTARPVRRRHRRRAAGLARARRARRCCSRSRSAPRSGWSRRRGAGRALDHRAHRRRRVVLVASPAYWLGLGADRLLHLSRVVAGACRCGCGCPPIGMTTPGAELHGLAHLADLVRHAILPVTLLVRDRRGRRRALRAHERARRHGRRLDAHRAREGRDGAAS